MNSRNHVATFALLATLLFQTAAKAEDPRLHGYVVGGLGESSAHTTQKQPKNSDVFTDVRFLGIPSLGFLPYKTQDKYTYYIAVVNFNIPATKKNTQHTDYAYARLTVHLEHCGNLKVGDDCVQYREPVRIISIWPVNDNLHVNRLAANALSATIQPSYAGISAGSISDTVSKSEAYDLNLAKVIGSADNDGNAAWTFYPEKSQPLILGAKNAIVVFAVRTIPRADNDATNLPKLTADVVTQLKAKSKLNDLEEILSANSMMVAMPSKPSAATPAGSTPTATILPTPTQPAATPATTSTTSKFQTDPLIVGTPPTVPGELKISCRLSYRINKFLSHTDVDLDDEDKIKFEGAQTAGNVIAMHSIDLPAGIVDTIAGTFSFVPESFDITVAQGQGSSVYAVSKKTGQLYVLTPSNATSIQIPPPTAGTQTPSAATTQTSQTTVSTQTPP